MHRGASRAPLCIDQASALPARALLAPAGAFRCVAPNACRGPRALSGARAKDCVIPHRLTAPPTARAPRAARYPGRLQQRLRQVVRRVNSRPRPSHRSDGRGKPPGTGSLRPGTQRSPPGTGARAGLGPRCSRKGQGGCISGTRGEASGTPRRAARDRWRRARDTPTHRPLSLEPFCPGTPRVSLWPCREAPEPRALR